MVQRHATATRLRCWLRSLGLLTCVCLCPQADRRAKSFGIQQRKRRKLRHVLDGEEPNDPERRENKVASSKPVSGRWLPPVFLGADTALFWVSELWRKTGMPNTWKIRSRLKCWLTISQSTWEGCRDLGRIWDRRHHTGKYLHFPLTLSPATTAGKSIWLCHMFKTLWKWWRLLRERGGKKNRRKATCHLQCRFVHNKHFKVSKESSFPCKQKPNAKSGRDAIQVT